MKNRRKENNLLLKHIFQPLIYFTMSNILAIVILLSLKKFLERYYILYYSRFNPITTLIDLFMLLKNNIFGDVIYIIILIIFSIPIYVLFMYKRTKSVVNILETVDIMANGDLDHTVEVKSKDYIGKFANNINSIVTQLRNITIEERRAQQTKTDLITNVSHDIRTPLTSIIGYLGLIEEDKYKDEVELRYYINIAYEKSKNLNILINDLFELTKMQNSTLKIDKIEINLVELLGQIMSHFDYQLERSDMKSRLNFSEDRLIVAADPNKLVRAFENLISNAVKYGKSGKYIDIVTKRHDNTASIQFINYGDAIPILDIPYIFERFYRVEKSRNRDDGGSGLGLAITKNIIELHGGNISVKSGNDKTIFEVRLPLINVDEEQEV